MGFAQIGNSNISCELLHMRNVVFLLRVLETGEKRLVGFCASWVALSASWQGSCASWSALYANWQGSYASWSALLKLI